MIAKSVTIMEVSRSVFAILCHASQLNAQSSVLRVTQRSCRCWQTLENTVTRAHTHTQQVVKPHFHLHTACAENMNTDRILV